MSSMACAQPQISSRNDDMNLIPTAFYAAACLAMPMAIGAAAAQDSQIVMTVTSDAGVRDYDLAALQALPKVSFTTSTIWTEGKQEFTGVALTDLLADAGIKEGNVMATAINDYAVEIPLDEIEDKAPIVAYHLNGEPMSVRDKGPLWIVYPYDESVEYQTETNFSRSIWQLDRLMLSN
ncbi:MAG: molybdopterin-dependent oxidoreductase [Paracoccus sp. (in: a-proteobacteria)]|nr:molybdopterin-dependent oxidoreductase [Paracoccus sp. (in: a-proteobacteria)]